MNGFRFFLPCLTAFCALAAAFAVGAAAAAERPDGRIALAPATRAFEARPGSRVRETLVLSNRSDAPQRFAIEFSDVAPLDADEGDVPFEILHGSTRDAGGWASSPARTVLVPAKSERDLLIDIAVPRGASDGSHLFAASTRELVSPTGGAIRPILMLTTIFAIDLPGAQRSRGVLSGVRFEPGTGRDVRDGRIRFTVRNDGAYVLRPRGNATLTSSPGGRTSSTRVQQFSVLPGARVEIAVPIRTPSAVGQVVASVRLETDAGRLSGSSKSSFVVAPWVIAIVAALMILMVGLLVGAGVRRARRHRAPDPNPDTP